MNQNQIVYSPYRIRKCFDFARKFPVKIEATGFGFLLTREAERIESKPVGLVFPRKPADPTDEKRPADK
ncbi:MAG TPA: hypothetical protein VHR66_14240 [Gemmataceae bacterium]|jgi:hypothetical protein|nr:hypothetical protein [Gemmataceae bacterium]